MPKFKLTHHAIYKIEEDTTPDKNDSVSFVDSIRMRMRQNKLDKAKPKDAITELFSKKK